MSTGTLQERLLDQPTGLVARRLALGYLDQASAAERRLADPADPEALHDFRVALRRLRSCLRSFRPQLEPSVPRRLRRRLRRVAAATGAGRDLEVHRAWLAAERDSLDSGERPGADWLAAQFGRRATDAVAALGQAAGKFVRLEPRLSRCLSLYPVRLSREGVVPEVPAGTVVADRMEELAAELTGHLQAVRTLADDAEAHRARIVAKRLRYLLEPVVEELPGAGELVERLRSLQELLGDLHDVHVFSAELGGVLERPGEVGDGARMGIAALAGRLRQRGGGTFERLQQEWLGPRAEQFEQEVFRVAGDARSAANAPG